MSLKLNRKKSYICGQVRGDRYARTYNQPGEEDKYKNKKKKMFVCRLLLVTAFIGAVSFQTF